MSGFNGLRVLAFESRRAKEIAQLISNSGGVPLVAPSTREVVENRPAPKEDELRLIRGILEKKFDAIIFTTGVGSRALIEAAESVVPRAEFLAALRQTSIIVRGPKPAAVMRELRIPVALTAPEPNTWREIVEALDSNPSLLSLKGSRIAVQEHGEPSTQLYESLRQRGAEIWAARVYHWELPEDTGPLKNAVESLVKRDVDVVLFTSRVQLFHAAQIAQEMGVAKEFHAALEDAVVASIGPVATEALRQAGIPVDFEPSHPRMGFLVKEVAERASELVREKSGHAQGRLHGIAKKNRGSIDPPPPKPQA
jgi:uroporphyrinogen-III synthase